MAQKRSAKNGANGNATANGHATQRKVGIQRDVAGSSRRLHDAADVVVHLAGAIVCIFVWVWHCTPAAARLPGAAGFGWFFKFLTFWGWTIQTLQYSYCALFSVTMPSRAWWHSMGTWCDDISCVAFCLATTVTAQFWALHYITGGLVERSSDRPEWLGFAVHVLNSILAWVDIAVARPRTFSPRARRLCAGFATFYSVFICACRVFNGRYPYPFMNKMHPVLSFASMLVLSIIVLSGVFALGGAMARGSARLLRKESLQEQKVRALGRRSVARRT